MLIRLFPDRTAFRVLTVLLALLTTLCLTVSAPAAENDAPAVSLEQLSDLIKADQGKVVIVNFFATWCQPCKMMHPILEQVKEVLGDRIRIIKVDVDKYGVTASQYGIQSVPTLMLFRRGEVLWRTSGVMQKSELLATIDPFLR